jgi:hypothetical protein
VLHLSFERNTINSARTYLAGPYGIPARATTFIALALGSMRTLGDLMGGGVLDTADSIRPVGGALPQQPPPVVEEKTAKQFHGTAEDHSPSRHTWILSPCRPRKGNPPRNRIIHFLQRNTRHCSAVSVSPVFCARTILPLACFILRRS